MSTLLFYGDDGSGKSEQAKSIAKASDNPEVWSFAVKNRRLYKDSGIDSKELLHFNDDQSINPYKTMDSFKAIVEKTIKEGVKTCIVIDEITFLRAWAQPVALEWFNKTYHTNNTKIGENNALAWEYVNKITYGELERLNTWAENNSAIIVALTNMTDVRVLQSGDDGKLHSITTGAKVVNAKDNIRKLADVRVKLEKDGKNGKGYYATFEKTQGWMTAGEEIVKVDKDGLLNELVMRGVIE